MIYARVHATLEDETLARVIVTAARGAGLKSFKQAQLLKEDHWKSFGANDLQAGLLVSGFAPGSVVAAPAVTTPPLPLDPTTELPEGKQPSTKEVQGFASALGIDSGLLTMFMMNGGGAGGDLSIADMIPVETVVAGYSPKVRNMFMVVMTRLEERYGVPIVVVNADGGVNKALTVEYVQGLEEGREPADDDIYYDASGQPHEVTNVGVDKQSIYDADPLDPNKALPQSKVGTGRINWNGVSLEAKQVVFFAVKSGELNPASESSLTWLREHVKPGVSHLAFHAQAPKALKAYNEAARNGSLPTLRTSMTGRKARRPEIMARRRREEPRDLTGVGGHTRDGDPRRNGSPFP
jgi:hypothetical protein